MLARLDDEARQQTAEMRRYYDAKKQATKRTTDPDSADDMAFVRDKFVALDPEKCDLCYMLCRSLKARRVVEFGTSFGVSTIYLAAAVRDTVRDHSGEGIVIGTEIEPTKAASSWSVAMPSTKERSIITSARGSRRRCFSEEYTDPKSSS